MIESKLKSNKNAAYVIAEVGQNHQGSFDTAVKYVDELARIGVDAVKFQMRDNDYLFSPQKLREKYNSNNAFAETYGEHRKALELSVEEMARLREHCKNAGVDFMCTPFDEPSLEHLINMDVDSLKIASFDFGNMPFLSKVASTNKHFVMSVGGGKYDLVDKVVGKLLEKSANFSLLHCVSEYPCPVEKVNLGRIRYLKDHYPSVQVGLSDHFSGIVTGPLGALMGAEIFEKHVTFNRSWKGTDHPFSLTIDAMERFIRDINRANLLVGTQEPEGLGSEYVFQKLGKSLIASVDIEKGEPLSEENMSGVIIGEGIPVRESINLLGRLAGRCYRKGELISDAEL